jgi:hypothetical protein
MPAGPWPASTRTEEDMTEARTPFRRATRAVVLAAATLVAPLVAPLAAGAQVLNYPAFQPPQVVGREYAAGVADGEGITSVVFQWREGLSPVSQMSFDVGLADPGGEGDVKFMLGGAYARQLTRASGDLPLDILFTGGAYVALTDPTLFRVPVGVSLGHRFPLEGNLALTPYLHPRVSLDYCSECGPDGDGDTDLGVLFDLGADFEVSPRLSLRLAFTFGGEESFGGGNAVGFGLAWRPVGLRR